MDVRYLCAITTTLVSMREQFRIQSFIQMRNKRIHTDWIRKRWNILHLSRVEWPTYILSKRYSSNHGDMKFNTITITTSKQQ
uniref:Uncharacterized protein n=1 Tax=Octopus bimaculoides TaxID=37653 RepID=A0A0L8GCP6_OCTBM